MNKAVFLDRDGVINRKLEGDYVKKWEEFQFLPDVMEAIKAITDKSCRTPTVKRCTPLKRIVNWIKCVGTLMQKQSMQNLKNILIFHPAGIGDAVLAVPALKAIRESHPESYIALVTSRRAKTLVELCPYVDEVFAIEMDAISNPLALLNGEKLSNVWRLISKLRRRRFDVIADFTRIGSRFSAVKRASLFSFIRGKYIVGRDTQGWGFFLDGKVYSPSKPIKHEVECCVDIAKFLGANSIQPELELFLGEEDRAFVELFLEENDVQLEKPIIGINPNADWPSKRWIKERFAVVADKLIREYNAQVVFVGSKGEMPLVKEISFLLKSKAFSAAGKTNLRQLAALIERFNLFITNDTGPMHIAAAVKTPVIALFGPVTPLSHRPYGAENITFVIWKNVECSPCGKIYCENHRCMRLISVEEVYAEAEKLLSR